MRRIALRGKYGLGKFALIDNDDYRKVRSRKWHLTKSGYVEDNSAWLLHRLVTNAPDDMLVDHVNGDPLDNRKSNLRICTQEQNSWNSKIQKKKYLTGYKGVTMIGATRYEVRIGKESFGCFTTAEEAAKIYDKEATRLYGKFARLNF